MKQQFSIFVISGIIMCLMGCNNKQCLQTPDLTMFELQGNVSFCRIVYSSDSEENDASQIITWIGAFTEKGLLSQCNRRIFETDAKGEVKQETETYKLERNEKGQLINIDLKDDQFVYRYNSDGTVAACDYLVPRYNYNENFAYQYDKEGRVVKRICSSNGSGDSSEWEKEIEYVEEDERGNWTKRLIHVVGGYDYIEERIIKYWDDESSTFEEEFIPGMPDEKGDVKYVPVQVVEEEPDEQAIFEVVEQMPEYPGGQAALMEFIAQNIQYPTAAKEAGTQGRVIVQFVVERDGSITGVKVVRSVGSYLDEEALRVMNSMPKWKPGMQRGKLVRVKFTVPVMFRL